MPRFVDHERRRRDILVATISVIAECGLRGLTIRAVAERLGGSTTLVTHYYRSQQALLDGLAESMITSWQGELEELELGYADPRERLQIFLEWQVSMDDEGVLAERTRINLLSERILGAEVRGLFESWEHQTKELLREHLVELVPARDLEMRVDMLRALTNGITLSAVEHPEQWPSDKMAAVLWRTLNDMGVAPDRERTMPKPKKERDVRTGSQERPGVRRKVTAKN